LLHLSESRARAEDLLQEVFLTALKSDALRLTPGKFGETLPFEPPPPAPSPEAEVEKKQALAAIQDVPRGGAVARQRDRAGLRGPSGGGEEA
jgi:hypothetical protein